MIGRWWTGPRIVGAAALLAAVLFSSACAPATTIAEIKAHPRDFNFKRVTIEGEVTGALNVPIIRAFTVKDATGEIVVVTDRAVPSKGDHVRVRGQVDQAFAVGPEVMVIVREYK